MEAGIQSDQRNTDDGKLLSLGDLLSFAFRRRATILAVVFAFAILGILYCIFATHRYQAEALVEIRHPDDSLGLKSLVQGTSQSPEEENPLEENVTLATKEAELASDTVVLRVINELHLDGTEDFRPSIIDKLLSPVFGLFSSPAKKDAPGTSFMDSPHRRAKAITTFNSHLKVEAVNGTRLISIKYSNPDANLAANVSNSLANNLALYSFQVKRDTTQQLSDWLRDEIQPVRQQAEALQMEEAKLRRETESYDISGTNATGQTIIYNPVLDRLQQSTSAVNQAESNRILRGAVSQIVKTGDPKLISGLAGSGMLGSGNPQSTTSLDLINALQTQAALQESSLEHDKLIYGDAYPKLIQEKAALNSINKALRDETDRLVRRAENDYTIASEQEQSTRSEHDNLLKHANQINDKFLRYQIVRQEAQDARQLYTDLNQRMREAGVTAGLQSADMTVFSPALAPDKPRSPRVLLTLAASLFAGAFFGIVLAGIQEMRDDKINSVKTVETELGIPVYGVLPDFDAVNSIFRPDRGFFRSFGRSNSVIGEPRSVGEAEKLDIEVVAYPESQYAEAFRALRTSILLSKPGETPKTILITSSTPAEGKSTTSLNLAATYARVGARTLLVEMDLRDPIIAKRAGLASSPDGLSRILTGQLSRNWVVPVSQVPNLYCIPGGQRSPDPYTLVSSELMETLINSWRTEYDMIILDGPPVLSVTDSVLISGQTDLILVVTRTGKTSINSLRRTHQLLPQHMHANIGAVLNAVSTNTEAYYEYYGHRNSAYTYQSVRDEGRASNV